MAEGDPIATPSSAVRARAEPMNTVLMSTPVGACSRRLRRTAWFSARGGSRMALRRPRRYAFDAFQAGEARDDDRTGR